MNLVILSNNDKNLNCLLDSAIKTDYEHIYILWDKPYSELTIKRFSNYEIYSFEVDVKPFIQKQYNFRESLLNKQTTLKKFFFISFLFNKGITNFFYTDDDVYFYKSIDYDATTNMIWQEDSLMISNILRNSFYRNFFDVDKILQLKVNKSIIVGNFYCNFTKEQISLYENHSKEFYDKMNSISDEDWLPFRKNGRNTKIFFIDSLFFTLFFKKLNETAFTNKRVNHYLIVSDVQKNLLNGIWHQTKIPKNKYLIHYNISDKSKFHDLFFKETL